MVWPITHLPLTCDETGVEHIVSVGLPARYERLEQAPLLFCVDGPWLFGTVLDATRIMSMSNEAPEAIVVGLSFADTAMGEHLRQRARWYTPTPYVPPLVTGVKGVTADECGRADDLRRFIARQVLPAVEGEHLGAITVSERWLIGHSFSALFALRTLLADPTLFDKWLLASPSIWWDDRSILAFEADYAAHHDDLAASVFMTHGELESQFDSAEVVEAVGFDFAMGANVVELAERLRSRNYPGLKLDQAELPGDHHASSIGAAVSKGLRALL
jgi:predicted alpha/beta superfamily hydrolase